MVDAGSEINVVSPPIDSGIQINVISPPPPEASADAVDASVGPATRAKSRKELRARVAAHRHNDFDVVIASNADVKAQPLATQASFLPRALGQEAGKVAEIVHKSEEDAEATRAQHSEAGEVAEIVNKSEEDEAKAAAQETADLSPKFATALDAALASGALAQAVATIVGQASPEATPVRTGAASALLSGKVSEIVDKAEKDEAEAIAQETAVLSRKLATALDAALASGALAQALLTMSA